MAKSADHPALDPDRSYERVWVDGAELRAELIKSGHIVPARRDGLTPLRLPRSVPVLRLEGPCAQH